MDEKGALNAYVLRNSADGETLAWTAAAPAKNDALKGLYPFPVAFLDLDADPNGVSGPKVVDFRVDRY